MLNSVTSYFNKKNKKQPSADGVSKALSWPSSSVTSSPGCAFSRTVPWNDRATSVPPADTATHTQEMTSFSIQDGRQNGGLKASTNKSLAAVSQWLSRHMDWTSGQNSSETLKKYRRHANHTNCRGVTLSYGVPLHKSRRTWQTVLPSYTTCHSGPEIARFECRSRASGLSIQSHPQGSCNYPENNYQCIGRL